MELKKSWIWILKLGRDRHYQLLLFVLLLIYPLLIYATVGNHFFLMDYVIGAFRFSYFSRASLDYIVKSGKQPDVIHIHNWETAIVGPLFWDVFVKQVQLRIKFIRSMYWIFWFERQLLHYIVVIFLLSDQKNMIFTP